MFGLTAIVASVALSVLSFPAAALYLTVVLNRRPRGG
jgi:hypothetical protein